MKAKLPWEIWLALKYLLSPKRERFTGIITILALIGVVLSVASLTVVNGVITGFKEIITEKILSLNPHLSISFYSPQEGKKILQTIEQSIPKKEIKSLQLISVEQGLIIKSGNPVGIILKAVDLKEYAKEKGFKYFNMEKFSKEDKYLPVIVGARLRDKLGIAQGETLSYLTLEGFYTPFGFFPKVSTLRVIGFFETGLYDYDLNLVFTSFEIFTNKKNPQNFSFEIKLKDPFKSNEYKKILLKNFGLSYFILDWQEWNKNLFSALKLEKLGLFVVLSLMVAVSLFTILSAMIMLVSEKSLDIAILRALGATSKSILKIFFLAGFILSLTGVILGLFLGVLTGLLLSKYPVIKLPGEVYPVEYMPISLKIFDLVIISLVTILISLLSSLYPAKKASLMNPAEILRKE